MEQTVMIIRLHNLAARAPKHADAAAIASLMSACDKDNAHSDSDVLNTWRQAGFMLDKDAWVILTRSGEIVSYAVLQRMNTQVLRFVLLVRPDYRDRGIETLLLWLIEARARELAWNDGQDARTVLRMRVNAGETGLDALLEQEGYHVTSHFWRLFIAVDQVAACSSATLSSERQLVLDVALLAEETEIKGPYIRGTQADLAHAASMYRLRQYDVYEKVLCEGVCHEVKQTPNLTLQGALA
jgi:GNAT superfamily N-acetyltransferase